MPPPASRATECPDAREVLADALRMGMFPGAVAEVGTADRPLWTHACGRLSRDPSARPVDEATIFDLASLTKVLATTSITMRLVEQRALGLDDAVSSHLSSWQDRDGVPAATLRDLLSHCSGLPAHAPLFRHHTSGVEFAQAICAMPLAYPPRSMSIYSDLGFMLLGFVLERFGPLTRQLDALLADMGGVEDLQFQPPRAWRSRTAPTRDDPWRGRLLVGEVDDDNAWALGGVAGHAGLFGTAPAVGRCARHLLRILRGWTGVFRRDTVRTFITRREDIPGSSRALGWDTMLPTSSCGIRMSPRAFGHVGFTGTSLWIDPDRDIYAVLLTNRVHPTPASGDLTRVRPAFHDAVLDCVERGGRDDDPASRSSR